MKNDKDVKKGCICCNHGVFVAINLTETNRAVGLTIRSSLLFSPTAQRLSLVSEYEVYGRRDEFNGGVTANYCYNCGRDLQD
jgi:hypothetical protein